MPPATSVSYPLPVIPALCALNQGLGGPTPGDEGAGREGLVAGKSKPPDTQPFCLARFATAAAKASSIVSIGALKDMGEK